MHCHAAWQLRASRQRQRFVRALRIDYDDLERHRLRAHRGQCCAKSLGFVNGRDNDGDERALFHGLPRIDAADLDVRNADALIPSARAVPR